MWALFAKPTKIYRVARNTWIQYRATPSATLVFLENNFRIFRNKN